MTRRKDGLWQETITINGKTKYFYGRTKAEVLRKIRAYKEEQERGAPFQNVAAAFWEEHEPTLAYNTAKSYKPAVDRACAEFENVPIKSILPQQVNKVITDFARLGYADKTVRTQLMIYSLIFQYAVKNGYVLANPARDLSVPKNLPKKKRTSPTAEDIQRVKESTGCTFGMFAFWAMYTGLRRGELLALEWSDVNLKQRTIRVNKSLYNVNNKPHIKPPKTATSVSTVPILDVLAKKIKPSRGLVFANADGGYITETQFQRLWELYCKESGVTATPHQFRHAYATMLFEAKVPPEEMQVLLRHAQLSTTMDVYTDIREEKIKAIYNSIYSIDIV